MSPFLEFRVWMRRGPVGERVLASGAAVVAMALLGWALVPLSNSAPGADDASTALGVGEDSRSDTAAVVDPASDTTVPGEVTSDGAASPSGLSNTGARTRTSGVTNPDTRTPADRCAGTLTASDQGVTPKEVLVAVAIIRLGGDVANQTFGIRGDLEDVARAAAAGINAEGGVGCRKLTIQIFRVNPLDQNDTRAKCLDIVAAKPFAVIDFGGYIDPVSRACFVENKLPFQSALAITEREGKAGYPYLYTASASADRQLRNWVLEAARRNTFAASNGFAKLGVFTARCEQDLSAKLLKDLNSVGVSDAQMSVFEFSCSPTPNELAQAMSQHRQAGVTHVKLSLAQIHAKSYVRNAAAISWRPVYLASDFGAIPNTTSQGDWNDTFDGTVAITSDRSGEYNSGIKHKLIAPCQDWYRKANVPPPDKDGDAAFGFCAFFTLFKRAADVSAPDLTRARLVPNLAERGGLFESVAYSDILYNKPGRFSGGDQVRAIQWRLDCRCWKVVDAFRPAP